MPNEPSLGEILNSADAERGSGQPAVAFNFQPLVQQLNQAAQYKSENDWRKYSTFLNNVKEQYKDLGQIEAMDTLTKDKPFLQQEAANIYADIAKNPREFFSGGSKFNEVQARLGKLQSMATESKQNAIFDFAHRQFVARDPSLNTDENKAKIEDYLNQPLGQRNPYMLDLPGLYDAGSLADELNKAVKTESPFSRPTADNQFIESGTQITHDLPKYLQLASTVYYQPDKNGVPIQRTWEKRFSQFPKDIQDHYKSLDPKDPAKAAYLDDLKNRIMGNTIESYKTQSNPNYLKKEEVAIAKSKLGLDWAKYNYAKDEDQFGAASVINEAKDIINKGEETQVDVGNGRTETVLRIGDPNLLQRFGNVDKMGNITNVPDAVEYNRDNDQLDLVYYEGKTKSGKNIISKKVSLDQRTWLKEIAKRSFPNKDIGKVNILVDDILNDTGNSLYKLAHKPEAEVQVDITKFSPVNSNGVTYYVDPATRKVYDANGKEIK